MARAKKNLNREDPQSQAPSQLNIVRTQADNHISLYVNDAQIQITPFDFRIMFGIITAPPSDGSREVHVTTIGEVRMSPQFVKRFVRALVGQIKGYEETIGPILLQAQDE